MHALFIDPDHCHIRFWIMALEKAGIEVTHVRDIDDGFSLLTDNQYDIIIFEMIMQPGRRYNHIESYEGLATGKLLARDLCELYPNQPLLCFHSSNMRYQPAYYRNLAVASKGTLDIKEFPSYVSTLSHALRRE